MQTRVLQRLGILALATLGLAACQTAPSDQAQTNMPPLNYPKTAKVQQVAPTAGSSTIPQPTSKPGWTSRTR
ncbi:MAG: hypothetical protein MUC97_14065 [Bernardetiaceae bacterium]|nr:hypothetical protein [Bernardetiaceae bacterium]